ncbi:MAG: Lrp/AsnC family transcriptional regulator [Thermodesulfatator sp.]|nr:MAG: Lrp/AsnC family transcriptional regulator [Thermodesulfatator sp.]
MDDKDRKLLNLVQKEFPVVERPFQVLAQKLGVREEEVLLRLERLSRKGILRQIGGIFNPQALGYRTTLAALEVPEYRLSRAVEVINSHPGVSHNYLRDHRLNLWFTLAVPPGKILEEEADRLARAAGAQRLLLLPIRRIFRIAVVFDLEEGVAGDRSTPPSFEKMIPGPRTIRLVRATQEPLPLLPRPFSVTARQAGTSEEDLLLWIREMLEKGVMRRFAGLVRHHRVGFRENIMVAWRVPEKRLTEVGQALASEQGITHCYERVSYPDWPYNLYTMLHLQKEPEKYLKELAERYVLRDYLPLRTLRELKKVRLKLFIEA